MLGCLMAAVWSASGLVTTPVSAATEEKPLACVWLNNEKTFQAFGSAYEGFAKNWLVIGQDWFQAYEIGGSAKHPLLGTPREDMGTVEGFVWARDVRCETWQVDLSSLQTTSSKLKDTNVSEVWGARLVARSVTFSEEGNAWTPPIEDGVLWEIYIANEGGEWTVEDNSVDAAILSTGAKERRPRPDELPKRKTPKAWR
ncbi:MAG: hypothetical protein AAFV45_08195 [Pseudomonadota bacterium]